MKRCNKCNFDNNDSNTFCSNCGNTLTEANNKDINYYRTLLHKDTILLLFVTAISGVVSFLFQDFGVFFSSIIYMIFLIILLCNKKQVKSFIGVIAIIISGLMIIISITGSSLFDIIYLVLGIFYLIHAIKYLKKLSKSNINNGVSVEFNNKVNKFKYLSLIPIGLIILIFILGVILSKSLVGLSWCGISILIVSIISIILCIILCAKKIRSILVYIILVISIMITVVGGIFVIDGIIGQARVNSNKNKYYSSEEFLIDYAKYVEEDVNEEIVDSKNLKKLNIDIEQETIIKLDDFVSIVFQNNFYSLNKLKESGYSCDGYSILKFKNISKAEEYNNYINQEISYNMKNYFDVNTYIKCSGKYKYMTDGYDIKNYIRR